MERAGSLSCWAKPSLAVAITDAKMTNLAEVFVKPRMCTSLPTDVVYAATVRAILVAGKLINRDEAIAGWQLRDSIRFAARFLLMLQRLHIRKL
jgi:hypothetical protein